MTSIPHSIIIGNRKAISRRSNDLPLLRIILIGVVAVIVAALLVVPGIKKKNKYGHHYKPAKQVYISTHKFQDRTPYFFPTSSSIFNASSRSSFECVAMRDSRIRELPFGTAG